MHPLSNTKLLGPVKSLVFIDQSWCTYCRRIRCSRHLRILGLHPVAILQSLAVLLEILYVVHLGKESVETIRRLASRGLEHTRSTSLACTLQLNGIAERMIQWIHQAFRYQRTNSSAVELAVHSLET